MMTSAQVVETSVNVTSNSPSQDYTQLDDHNLPNYGLILIRNTEFQFSRIQFRGTRKGVFLGILSLLLMSDVKISHCHVYYIVVGSSSVFSSVGLVCCPDFSNLLGKRKLGRIIEGFKKSGVK